MKAPTNTAEQAKQDPMGVLAAAMVMGSSESILHQEAQGQREFVDSETLPTRFMDKEAKGLLEKWGVKFVGPVPDDDMFQYVQLPAGWKKEGTGHSMWSNLLDDKGRKRAAIFYKAAFYDRSAHLSLTRRFAVSFDYEAADKKKIIVAHVMDGDAIVFSSPEVKAPEKCERDQTWRMQDEAKAQCEKWLKERYPNWKDVAAYWD